MNDQKPDTAGQAMSRRGQARARPARREREPLVGPAGPILGRLFAARGLPRGEWWPFLVQGEGKELPGGVEACSGFVLARDGRVYGWWLGWDDAGEDYLLERWWPVPAPAQEFAGDAEYHTARRRLQ